MAFNSSDNRGHGTLLTNTWWAKIAPTSHPKQPRKCLSKCTEQRLILQIIGNLKCPPLCQALHVAFWWSHTGADWLSLGLHLPGPRDHLNFPIHCLSPRPTQSNADSDATCNSGDFSICVQFKSWYSRNMISFNFQNSPGSRYVPFLFCAGRNRPSYAVLFSLKFISNFWPTFVYGLNKDFYCII